MMVHTNNPTRLDAEYRQILKRQKPTMKGSCVNVPDRKPTPDELRYHTEFVRERIITKPKFDINS